MATKNITVKIDAEVYRKARIKAAERGTSVSTMVREFLSSLEGADQAGIDQEAKRRQALLERLWARTDELPRLEGPATMESRDALYRQAMKDRGVH